MAKNQKEVQDFFVPARWNAREIEAAVEKVVAAKREAYAQIACIEHVDAIFPSTIMMMERIDVRVFDTLEIAELLMNVHPHKGVRDMAQKMTTWAEGELITIEHNKCLYDVLCAVQKKREVLRIDERKLLNDTVRYYRRKGFDLRKEQQRILKRNQIQLAKLSTQFSQNINEYHDELLVTKEDLQGLPESYITGLNKKEGWYVVTLDYPDLVPFMAYADSRAKRKELWYKMMHRGGEKNVTVLQKVLKYRKENARLLGYKNHAAYVLEERMTKNVDCVEKFISDILKKVQKRTESDVEMLQEYMETMHGVKRLMPWDITYAQTALKKRDYSIDSEALREYFPLEHVLQEMMTMYAKFFSVRFERTEDVVLWHKDVRVYRLLNEDGSVRAYLAMDLYPRKNKFGHAAVFQMATGWQDGDVYHAPAACLVTNFPAPTKKRPSLLSHDEVVVLFHEFGHAMHQTLTRAALPSQSGLHVVWDFAELPSQLLEYWAWDPRVLRKITRHHETGEAISTTIIKKLIAADDFQKGYTITRQMIFASFDMTIHTKNVRNMSLLYTRLVKESTGVTMPKDHLFSAGFGHLMGYDAGYYGYMWTKVFAADVITDIKKGGMLSARMGKKYCGTILEKGSSDEEMNLLKNFLGRKPNMKAFIKELK